MLPLPSFEEDFSYSSAELTRKLFFADSRRSVVFCELTCNSEECHMLLDKHKVKHFFLYQRMLWEKKKGDLVILQYFFLEKEPFSLSLLLLMSVNVQGRNKAQDGNNLDISDWYVGLFFFRLFLLGFCLIFFWLLFCSVLFSLNKYFCHSIPNDCSFPNIPFHL